MAQLNDQDLQDPLFFKVSILRYVLATEDECWLQMGTKSTYTLDNCDQLKAGALNDDSGVLCLRVQKLCIVHLPTPAKLNPLFVHVVYIVPGYVVVHQELCEDLKVILDHSWVKARRVKWVESSQLLQDNAQVAS